MSSRQIANKRDVGHSVVAKIRETYGCASSLAKNQFPSDEITQHAHLEGLTIKDKEKKDFAENLLTNAKNGVSTTENE